MIYSMERDGNCTIHNTGNEEYGAMPLSTRKDILEYKYAGKGFVSTP